MFPGFGRKLDMRRPKKSIKVHSGLGLSVEVVSFPDNGQHPVSKIRAKYPNPVALNHGISKHGIRYDVLGAAVRFRSGSFVFGGFPTASVAASVLEITEREAKGIIRANDKHAFDLAWGLLDKALSKAGRK